jgi:HAD superfamily hydrolase (TIGR01490 family)
MNLALFDFDGTITTKETYPYFIRAAVAPRRLAIGWLLLGPLVLGYRLGLVPGRLLRALIVRIGLAGRDAAEIQAAGERFAREVLPGMVRPQALDRIRWHQARGDTVVVVSGGLDVYLDAWRRQHGLELICSRLESRDGRLTGRYSGRDCVSAEKSRRVRERFCLEAFDQVYAYGDTHEDLDLLELADRRWYRWQELGT